MLVIFKIGVICSFEQIAPFSFSFRKSNIRWFLLLMERAFSMSQVASMR